MTHTYLVGLKPGVDPSKVEAVGDFSVSGYDELDFEEHGKGRTVRIEADRDTVENLRSDPDVEYVEEDREDMHTLGQPSVGSEPHALEQQVPWGITSTRADEVHAGEGIIGTEVDVAITDTGISPEHPDLQGNIGEGHAVRECSGDCSEPWDDDNMHGTHVAGTVAALDNNEGVLGGAPGVTLHAIKVLSGQGSGTFSDVAEGIRIAADQNYEVINMSLGSSTDSSTVRRAVEYASEAGVVIVCAAGNSGPGDGTVGYPAKYPECIAVAASDKNDNIAEFSSRGEAVEVTAPGVNVLSTVPGGEYQELDGTSMACPHVAFEAALLIANETLGVRGAIKASAKDLGHPEKAQGHGLIDCKAAIDLNEPLAARFPETPPEQVKPGDTEQVKIEVTSTTERSIAEHFNLQIVNGRTEVVDGGDIIQDIDPGEWVPHTFEGVIPQIPEKVYRWRVTDNDGTPLAHASVTVGEGDGGDDNLVAEFEVVLEREDDGGGGDKYPMIRGQVWGQEGSGRVAVDGALVSLSGPQDLPDRATNSDGVVTWEGVETGSYSYSISAPAPYKDAEGDVPPFGPESATVTVR